MDINITQIDTAIVAKLAGEITAHTAPDVQANILPIAQPSSRILLDLSNVSYMSSAGLRVLLSVYRKVMANNAQLLLVGISEDIKDIMFVTGFLDFFTTCDTLESGFAALK